MPLSLYYLLANTIFLYYYHISITIIYSAMCRQNKLTFFGIFHISPSISILRQNILAEKLYHNGHSVRSHLYLDILKKISFHNDMSQEVSHNQKLQSCRHCLCRVNNLLCSLPDLLSFMLSLFMSRIQTK